MDNTPTVAVDPKAVEARTEFRIPAENLEALKAKFEDLNKKVARLQKKGLAVDPVAIQVDEKPIIEKGTREYVNVETNKRVTEEFERIFFMVRLVAPKPPKVDGWEFVAALTHVEGVGTVLRVCPGADVAEGELARFREASPENCDHCHAKRRRNDTFIVRRVKA